MLADGDVGIGVGSLLALLTTVMTGVTTVVGVLWKKCEALNLKVEAAQVQLTTAKEEHAACKLEVALLKGQMVIMAADAERARQEGPATVVTNEQGFVREWSPSATLLFRFPQIEALGKHVSILIPERLQGPFNAAWKRMIDAGHPPRRVHRTTARDRDGTEFGVSLLYSSWDAEGERMFGATIRLDPAGRAENSFGTNPAPVVQVIAAPHP